MPLGALEREVLRPLPANRHRESHVAVATVLDQNPCSPRTSSAVDVFQDTIDTRSESSSETEVDRAACKVQMNNQPNGTIRDAAYPKGTSLVC